MTGRPPPGLGSVANVLGLVRIGATPVIMALLLNRAPGAAIAALVIFIVAAGTDFLDGRIARARDEVSPLGIFMDLVADKVLVAGVLIAMVEVGVVPTWIAATILIREFVVQSVRQLAAAVNVVISAGQLGKLKTLVTLGGLALLMLASGAGAGSTGDTEAGSVIRTVGFWTLVVATLLTVLSGLEYLRRAWPMLSGGKPPPAVRD
jgi:CDP-diacylglycerol--glycerol-3-phosphate 3-phosphatidyltransferase